MRRTSDNVVTLRRNWVLGSVWRLSKLTTHALGTPSSSGFSSSSDTRPRTVRVNAATTTDPMWSATGSRVRTRTGRSPPGVAANQISPRRIGPVSPLLRRTPVRDAGQRFLVDGERLALPRLRITFTRQRYQVSVRGISKQLRSVHAQLLRPLPDLIGLMLIDPEAHHCHTAKVLRHTPCRPAAEATAGVNQRRRSAPPRWSSFPRPQTDERAVVDTQTCCPRAELVRPSQTSHAANNVIPADESRLPHPPTRTEPPPTDVDGNRTGGQPG